MKRLVTLAALAALSAFALTGCNRPEVQQYARDQYNACIQDRANHGITGPIADAICQQKAAQATQQRYGVSVAP